MLFTWWRNRRRRKLIRQPFPESWKSILDVNVHHYARLNPAEREKLHRCVQVFIAEKYWEGCGGLELTEEMQVTIAGHACLLVLGRDDAYFDRLQTVLVYPDTYAAPVTEQRPDGVVVERTDLRLGEAWSGGPVIVAWEDVPRAGHPAPRGQNVVLHEFAHVLDMEDRNADGTPALADTGEYRRWQDVMTVEYERLRRASSRHEPTVLDWYGAKNPAEFFAVSTECFFERPSALKQRHPQLYDVLRSFYKQDPEARLHRAPA